MSVNFERKKERTKVKLSPKVIYKAFNQFDKEFQMNRILENWKSSLLSEFIEWFGRAPDSYQ